jgi:phosphoribosylformylglycinamidine synthase
VVRRLFQDEGDAVILLGTSAPELGGSEYLKTMHGLIRGVPPRLDLAREAALQRVLVAGAASRLFKSAHDCAEGGVAVTLAECCFDTTVGVQADLAAVPAGAAGSDEAAFSDIAALFGESASRVVVSVAAGREREALDLAGRAGVPAVVIGRVGGERIRVSVAGRLVLDEVVATAERIWDGAIADRFERRQTVA